MDEMAAMTEEEARSGSGMIREQPDVPDARRNLVDRLQKEVEADKAHWKKDFDRMREDQRFAREGGLKSWVRSNKYVANIIQRHVRSKINSLYAKNPKVVVRRRKRRDFRFWDGTQESLMLAHQAAQMVAVLPGMAPPPALLQAQQIIADAAEGMQRRKLHEDVADTLQLLIQAQISEQVPPFKRRMKTLVRNAVVCGVGYVKLGFQRLYEKRPETMQRIAEIELRLANIERLMAEVRDGEVAEYDAEMEQLRQVMAALQSETEVLAREGLVFDFPSSMAVIPHRKCHTLAGFLGADWVTEEFMMSRDEIMESYGVDMKGAAYRPYTMAGKAMGVAPDATKPQDHLICVWQIYHRRDGVVYTVADGYADFLEEPGPPPVRLERFWPWFPLILNELEDEETIYPPSDVFLLRSMQNEYNRARQSLREHRRANRPKYAAAKGALTESDKEQLKSHQENAVLELEALQSGQKVDDVLQPVKTVPIDPNLYEVAGIFDDFQRVGGSQEANLGGVAKGTATESSIAEASRMSDLGSNKDDLDDLLNELFREAGTVALTEFSAEQVEQIVGPGAVWPEWTAAEIAGELYLEVEAGSSGRPNKQMEMQNFREMAPLLIQIPGLKPQKLLEEGIRRLDDRLEVSDLVDPAMPAIVALNRMSQVSTGDPATDPNQQGAQGGDNAQRPQESEMTPAGPGGQPQRQGGAAGGMGGGMGGGGAGPGVF